MERMSKTTIIKATSLVLIIVYVVCNVNYKTSLPFNSFLHRYYGKDDLIVRQFESICLLSALFYFVLATRKKFLFLLIGFAIGFLSFLLSNYISYNLTDNIMYPHIFACVLFTCTFYLLPRRWKHDVSK